MKNFILLAALTIGCSAEVVEGPTTEKETVIERTIVERSDLQLYLVDGDSVAVEPFSEGEALAYCNEGDTLITGGCGAAKGGSVRMTIPVKPSDGSRQFWLCIVTSGETGSHIDPRAVCAKGNHDAPAK